MAASRVPRFVKAPLIGDLPPVFTEEGLPIKGEVNAPAVRQNDRPGASLGQRNAGSFLINGRPTIGQLNGSPGVIDRIHEFLQRLALLLKDEPQEHAFVRIVTRLLGALLLLQLALGNSSFMSAPVPRRPLLGRRR